MAHRAILAEQRTVPVAVAEDERRTWWMFRDRFFWEDDGLGPDEVMALVHERERRLRRRIERAQDLMAADAEAAGPRREAIPEDVRREVFRRDGGRCVDLRLGRAAAVRPRDPGRAGRGVHGRPTSSCSAPPATAQGRLAVMSARRAGRGDRSPG